MRRDFRIYILSAVVGAAVCGVALLLFSVLMWLLQLPVRAGDLLSLLIFGAGCLAAGITSGKIKRKGGIGCGVRSALIMLAVLILVTLVRSWFGFGFGVNGEFLLSRLTTAVFCGTIGGVIGVNKN
jgi:putative membrane protein (TIGR04086 family)